MNCDMLQGTDRHQYKMWVASFLFILFLYVFPQPALLNAETRPIVESIYGNGRAWYLNKGETKDLMIRQPLDPNSHVKTEKNASVKILFSDGSMVTIGQNSDFEVNAQEYSKGVPLSDLHVGNAHANIQKTVIDASRKKIKFLIKTKAAVFGVRGTDFVVSTDDKVDTSEIHTLEGSVDLAKNIDDLNSGKSIVVSENETSQASPTGLSSVKSFDPEEYVRKIQESDPEYSMSFQSFLPSRFEWLKFRLSTLFISQSSGGSLVTGTLSYNPHLKIIGPIGFSGQLSLFPLKTKIEKKNYLGYSIDALATIDFFSAIGLELGAGVQSWGKHGKAGLNLVGQTVIKFGKKSTLEGIHIGASRYSRVNDTDKDDTLSFRAGIGIRI